LFRRRSVEVVERDRRRPVVARLSRGVPDRGGFQRRDEGEDARAVADVELVVREVAQLADEALLVPARVALRPKKTAL